MTEASTTSLVFESFLDFLKTLPWCKQESGALVAVQKCTPELIVTMSDREARVYPGGAPIKINKSWLTTLQEKNADGNPIPVLLIWKSDSLELWYRRHKSHDFPYDAWQNPVAEAYERECIKIPASAGGAKFVQFHTELLASVKSCPQAIPPL